MGVYDNQILPRLLVLMMENQDVHAERKRCLHGLGGDVLEIGFGSGLNLPHYPAGVTKVVGIDPSQTSAKLARKRIEAAPFQVETIGLSAEKIPVPDGSFQTVVSTFTLCSIPDVSSALGEIRRALAPNGRFHFVEHGLSDDPKVQGWQNRMNGFNQWMLGGCNLNRRIGALVKDAGFTIESLENAYMPGAPKFAGYLYRGVARRA